MDEDEVIEFNYRCPKGSGSQSLFGRYDEYDRIVSERWSPPSDDEDFGAFIPTRPKGVKREYVMPGYHGPINISIKYDPAADPFVDLQKMLEPPPKRSFWKRLFGF